MARNEPDPSAADVDRRFAEIVDDLFRPELDRSTDAWTILGQHYTALGNRRAR